MGGRYEFEDEPRRTLSPALVAVGSAAALFAALAVFVVLAGRRAPTPTQAAVSRPPAREPVRESAPAVAERPRGPQGPRLAKIEPPPERPPERRVPDPPPRPDPPQANKITPEPLRFPVLEPGRLVYGEYHLNKIKGFSVYINRTVFEESRQNDNRPLDCLQDELDRLTRLAPQTVKAMQTVKVFVEWDHVEAGYPDSVAVFYGGRGEGYLRRGIAPFKAGHVTVLSLKRITEMKRRRTTRKAVVILHEMAHAAQHYNLGDGNPFVLNAYEQAMTRGLYESVPDELRGTVRAYAATNQFEYFAELTCAYLDYCNYYPHDRKELREYDSAGYELMRKVWGEVKD